MSAERVRWEHIQRVFEPAEAKFFDNQPEVETRAAEILGKKGAEGIESFLNTYAQHCLTQVGYGYHELVDYLMFRYLVDNPQVAPPRLPAISAPVIPPVADN